MNADATRFPLAWPTGWPRTSTYKRQKSNFRTRGAQLSVFAAIQRLSGEVDRLGARDVILSTNMETRLDGLPRSGQAEPKDPGAALYFSLRKAPRCLACDRWTRTADWCIAHRYEETDEDGGFGFDRMYARWDIGRSRADARPVREDATTHHEEKR